VVLVSAPSEAVAASLATTLVNERLIACANLIPKIRSIYRWEGTVCDEAEALMVLKTRSSLVGVLIERVKGLHPSSVPEVLELPVAAAQSSYLKWVIDETRT
jgi:periplasmic divalent cation tolerance protein